MKRIGETTFILDDARRFYKWLGVEFTKPRSRRVEKLPFIPLESEIDAFISGLGSTSLALLPYCDNAQRNRCNQEDRWPLIFRDVCVLVAFSEQGHMVA